MTYFKPLIISIVALVTATAGAMTGAMAFSREPHHRGAARHRPDKAQEQQAIREAVKRGEVQPLPKILEVAQKAVPGDILEVELEYDSWGLKYELKILTASGLVRKVDINANTAAIVRIDDD